MVCVVIHLLWILSVGTHSYNSCQVSTFERLFPLRRFYHEVFVLGLVFVVGIRDSSPDSSSV